MIEDVARALAAALPDCTPEEIADVLWLLTVLPGGADDVLASLDNNESAVPPQMSKVPPAEAADTSSTEPDQPTVTLAEGRGPTSGGRMVSARAVGLRAPAAIGRPLSTARVFSLFKRISGPGPPEVDIDATVEATADARRLIVVTKPGRERGLDVALVGDTSPVMTVYENALTEFEALLIRAGAFRSVTRWTLVPGPEILIRDRAGAGHHPDRLIDPSGRRLVLLMTDAVADHWYGPATWEALRRWGEVMPTALIHVLPEQYRAGGPLGQSAFSIRSRSPGGPNLTADIEIPWWDTETTFGNPNVPVPVVPMRRESLEVWAQAVTAGTAWVDAVWARQPSGRSAREANADVSAEDRVRAFQARASHGAQKLARILAGAPVLSRPLISILQGRLLPETGTSELAEVLVSGLLERTAGSRGVNEDWQLRFRPSVSELLRRGTTAAQEWDTFEVISEYLVRNAGTGSAIHALLADPQGIYEVDAQREPFAALGRSVAARLRLRSADGGDAGARERERLNLPAGPVSIMTESVQDALAIWLQEQPWFAGKGRTFRDLAIVVDTEVVAGDPGMRHLIVLVSHGATADHYQILIGLRSQLPDWLEHARIGQTDSKQVYDALHDPALMRHLIRAIAASQTIESLTFSREPGAEIDTGLDSIVLTAEQSNTSLVFGEQSILKVFRRVFPGPNPDLEVTAALSRLGSPHVAEPFGSIETLMDGVTTTLAILSKYLRTATDGWTLAATSVRDLYADPYTRKPNTGNPSADHETSAAGAGGDFAGEAYRLGAATAEAHQDLADAFGTDELSPDAIRDMAEQMFRRLDLATAAVPELARYTDMIGTTYHNLTKIRSPTPAQRVHGDYHLGQVMRTETGWIILDFEGEPGQPAVPAAGPLLPHAGRGRDAPLVRLRGPLPAAQPPGRGTAARSGPGVDPAQQCRVLRRLRRGGRARPGGQRGAAARPAAGQSGIRSNVRNQAPAILAADPAGIPGRLPRLITTR